MQLAIETTGRQGTVAILRGESLLDEITLPAAVRTAAALAPAVDQAIRECHRQRLSPGLISVAAGPGSFTGLRIGVTTAKTLGYARRWPLVAVDSLAAIAAAALADTEGQPDAADQVLVGVTAYRRQVFCGRFTRDVLLPPLEPAGLRAGIDPLRPPGVDVVPEPQWHALLEQLPAGTGLAGDRRLFGDVAPGWIPRRGCDAVGIGLLGLRAAMAGRFTDPLQLVPRYLKPSAAEEQAGR